MRLVCVAVFVLPILLFGWRGYIFAVPAVLLVALLAGVVEGIWRGVRGAVTYHGGFRNAARAWVPR